MTNPETHNNPEFVHDRRVIVNFLREIGIPSSILGFTYIQEAVVLATNGGKRDFIMMQNVYGDIARTYNVKPSSVERAIRHAIGICWRYNDNNTLKALFGFVADRKPATNKEFIATIADEYLLRMTNT